MASSAVYRYVTSRDELLTRLIIDAYDSLGAAAEAMQAQVDRADLVGRWAATCRAVRDWAIANPNEYALIYGSPVPGYVAPVDTTGPASRASSLLLQILIDGTADGQLAVAAGKTSSPGAPAPAAAPAQWRIALGPVRSVIPADVPLDVIQTGLMVWSALFGVISFELFGQFHNVIEEDPGAREAFFTECVSRWADQLGLG